MPTAFCDLFMVVMALLFLNGYRMGLELWDNGGIRGFCGNPSIRRWTAYLLMCIPLRIVLAAASPEIVKAGGSFVFGLMSAGFLFHHFKAPKTGYAGGKVWWSRLRLFHAGMFLLAFLAGISDPSGQTTQTILIADVVASLAARLFIDTD